MDTEATLNAELDENPGDTLTRMALIDLLLDQGRDDEAAGVEWLMREGKWPTFKRMSEGGQEMFHAGRPWDWWGMDDGSMVSIGPAHASLPKAFWRDHYASYNPNGRYRTRQEAEASLVAWARRAGLIAPLAVSPAPSL